MRGVTTEETPDDLGAYRAAGEGTTLTLRYSWRSRLPATLLLLGFSLAWDAALFVAIGSGHFPFFMAFHAVVGVVLSYMTLATLLNHTVVKSSRTQISVSSGPIPLLRARRVDAREVVAIAWAPVHGTRRRRSPSSYALEAVTRSGARVLLCDVFPDPEVPAYLAEKVSLFLGCRLQAPPAARKLRG